MKLCSTVRVFQIVTTLVKAEPVDELLLKHEENDVLLKCEEENEVSGDFTDFQAKSSETEITDENFLKNDPDDAFTDTKNLIYTSDIVDITKFICDYCGQQFDKKKHLRSHMTKHKKELVPTNFPCTVEGCEKSYKMKKSLISHKLNVHKIEPEACGSNKKLKLCCDKCPKWFTNQHNLDAHVRGEHEGLEVRWMMHFVFIANNKFLYLS